MSSLINKFRGWFKQKSLMIGCKIWGHAGISIIEEYSRTVVMGNFKGDLSKKIVKCAPYRKTTIAGKMKCPVCGMVFLGVIVNENLSDKVIVK